MREIKCRAKRTDTGEWVYGAYFGDDKRRYIITQINDAQHAVYGYRSNDVELYVVDPATVGQYTGLKDKNGKEIYEGDIVNTWIEGTIIIDGVTTKGYSHELMTVEFVTTNERLGRFVVIDSLGSEWSGFSNTAIEVIGNVWEDGGLLNDC